jgi:hypothetical protein
LRDCTHPRRRRTVLALICLIVAGALAVAGPTAAWADGDPASDVLDTTLVYVPLDGGISPTLQTELAAITAAAQRAGYPLRVAMIDTPADLGSIGALWRAPETYARFLGAELSDVFHGTLLVVMPDGYGIAPVGAGGLPASAPAALAGLTRPGTGDALATATLTAIRRLAAAGGHPLAAPQAVRTARGTSAGKSSAFGPMALLALVIGAAIIAGAWTASVRARPFRRRDGVASPHGR